MLGGQRKRDTVLAQVVAKGNFAAEAIAARRQPHFIQIILFGLNKHRDVETGEAQRFGDGFLIAKVG